MGSSCANTKELENEVVKINKRDKNINDQLSQKKSKKNKQENSDNTLKNLSKF